MFSFFLSFVSCLLFLQCVDYFKECICRVWICCCMRVLINFLLFTNIIFTIVLLTVAIYYYTAIILVRNALFWRITTHPYFTTWTYIFSILVNCNPPKDHGISKYKSQSKRRTCQYKYNFIFVTCCLILLSQFIRQKARLQITFWNLFKIKHF